VYNVITCSGVFYYLIGNLPAEMRSKVHTMQLLAIVKKSFIDKYTMNAVLKPIVDDVKKLVCKRKCSSCMYTRAETNTANTRVLIRDFGT